MAITLTKGQTINLDKGSNDLKKITIGLGWKVRKKPAKKGFFDKLLGGEEKADDYDLDAIAFLLDENGKVRNVGDSRLAGGDVVFFNNLRHPTGHVYHTGDNREGGAGNEDDEQIVVQLENLGPQYHRILFLVCIYQGRQKGQHFGNVEKAFIRACDGRGAEIARYDLTDDPAHANARTLVFGEVYRKDGGWKFRAIGEGDPTDSFVDILKKHS